MGQRAPHHRGGRPYQRPERSRRLARGPRPAAGFRRQRSERVAAGGGARDGDPSLRLSRAADRSAPASAPFDRPPADIGAAEAVRPVDRRDGLIGAVARLADRGAAGGDVEHAAAIRDQPVQRRRGAGLEHLGAVDRLRGREAADRRALPVAAGIALGRHHDRERRRVAEAGRLAFEPAFGRGEEEIEQVARHPHHQHLAFGIAETDIVFDELRPLGGDHQPGEQDALERRAARRHGADGRLDDLGHDARAHGGIDHRRWRIGAHAACVRALIAVEGALVILRRAKGDGRLAVGDGEEARLLADKAFLDHHLGARRAEGAVEAGVDGGKRLVQRLGDNDALAGGDAVRLDDDRRAHRARIGARGLRLREALIGGGGDAGFRAEILGEALRAFERRRRLGRPEHADARLHERIGKPRDQRRLRPDHDEIDRLASAEGDDALVIIGVDSAEQGIVGDTGITGRRKKPLQPRRLRQLPGQRMLAPARADQKDIEARIGHGSVPAS